MLPDESEGFRDVFLMQLRGAEAEQVEIQVEQRAKAERGNDRADAHLSAEEITSQDDEDLDGYAAQADRAAGPARQRDHQGIARAGAERALSLIHISILSSMEVVKYGTLPNGLPLYCDKLAFESDGIVLLHKVKPHTDFQSNHESGLVKMIGIGLGKHKGATALHSQGFAEFGSFLNMAAEQFMLKAPVAFGVGIVQNAYDELRTIRVIPREQILEADEQLLQEARQQIAGFKFDDIDVLIIDQIGKNISGYGFDPNVIGRSNSKCYGFKDPVQIKRLFVRGLTPQSHHNGSGLADVDITTRRCLNDVDWAETWTNLITCTEIQGAKIPMYMNNDRDALLVALRCCGGTPRPHRVVRIRDTLSLYEIQVSEALYDSIKDQPDIEYVCGPVDLCFDGEGFLLD